MRTKVDEQAKSWLASTVYFDSSQCTWLFNLQEQLTNTEKV
jgi:hypothetical protein